MKRSLAPSTTQLSPVGSWQTCQRVVLLTGTLLTLLGCASGYGSGPPGGPIDRTPVLVTGTIPDTNATRVTRRDLIVRFNKVISERPSAPQATSLADLVVISPRDGLPDVDWNRDNISIRQRHPWRRNTTYTVTILPGISDLRGNLLHGLTTITFSTGTEVPATVVQGAAFEATRGTPNAGALVEVVPRNDTSLVYVAVVDSSGRFTLRGIQPGTYLVRGYVDENRNRGFDAREPFDTLSLTLRATDTARVELLTFVHDSLGPQLGTVDVQDSVTLRASFDTPIAPSQQIDTTTFVLLGPDSVRVPLRSAVAIRADSTVLDTTAPARDTANRDTLRGNVLRRGAARRGRAQRDTARQDTVKPPVGLPRSDTLPRGQAADTTVRHIPAPPLPPAKPTRPLLRREVVIVLQAPLRPKTEYRLRALNVLGASGVARTSSRTFTTPEVRPASPVPGAPPTRPAAPAPSDSASVPRRP